MRPPIVLLIVFKGDFVVACDSSDIALVDADASTSIRHSRIGLAGSRRHAP
jgi:hypothetical protein